MDAAMKYLLKSMFDDYLNGLDNLEELSFSKPVKLSNLTLKADAINKDLEEAESPIRISDGKIGFIELVPGWLGGLTVKAGGIELSLSVNPLALMKNAMATDDDEDSAPANAGHENMAARQEQPPHAQAGAPPRPVFCSAHGSSEQRPKCAPQTRQCRQCKIELQTNYEQFTVCPHCSSEQNSCMICGAAGHAASNGQPEPACMRPGPQGGGGAMRQPGPQHSCSERSEAPPGLAARAVEIPPTAAFCVKHSSSERRPKGEREQRPCQACRGVCTTNYQQFALCPPCSGSKGQCLICGDVAVNPSSARPPTCNGQLDPRQTQSASSRPSLDDSSRGWQDRLMDSAPPELRENLAGHRSQAPSGLAGPWDNGAELPPPPPPFPGSTASQSWHGSANTAPGFYSAMAATARQQSLCDSPKPAPPPHRAALGQTVLPNMGKSSMASSDQRHAKQAMLGGQAPETGRHDGAMHAAVRPAASPLRNRASAPASGSDWLSMLNNWTGCASNAVDGRESREAGQDIWHSESVNHLGYNGFPIDPRSVTNVIGTVTNSLAAGAATFGAAVDQAYAERSRSAPVF